MATNGGVANGDLSSSGTGTGSGSASGSGDGRGSQSQVWTEVTNTQQRLNANMSVDVTANSSASSLQLSLENKTLKKEQEGFAKTLAEITKGKSDVIGYAFAINGKLNSADIYVSNHLFNKLLLKAAVVEAISLADQPKAAAEPAPADVQTLLADAEKGQEKQRGTVAKSKVVTKATTNEALYEMRDKANNVVHRNYVKLN